jgi:basic membrane protein A and related proteins
MKRWVKLLALGTILLTLAAACGTGEGGTSDDESTTGDGGEEVVKAAWIYIGPRNDGGWTQAHDEGRMMVEEELGDQVETAYLENVPEEPAAAARAIESFARKDFDIIFTTSFGYMDPTLEVAEKYPDVKFEHCSGFKTADNMANYFGAMEEASYLAGMAAGGVTKSDTIGRVLAFPIPEVIRLTNAFALGAREVNPDATVQSVFINTWFDPQKEKSAAQGLLDSGADVLSQHVDSPATGQAAEAEGAYWVGYDSDASEFAPNAWVTAPVWNWGPYYVDRVQAVIDGTWESQSYYGHLSDGIVDIAPFGDTVPQEIQDKVEAKKEEIAAGDFDVFAGPLVDQDGDTRYGEGEAPTLEERLSMDWFVEGVEGNIPSS